MEDEKVPILGMTQRCGHVVIKMLPNVKTITIGTLV